MEGTRDNDIFHVHSILAVGESFKDCGGEGPDMADEPDWAKVLHALHEAQFATRTDNTYQAQSYDL